MKKIKFLAGLLSGLFWYQCLFATPVPNTRWTSPRGGVEVIPCVWEGKVGFDVTVVGKMGESKGIDPSG